jgi:hypothetical protein
MKAAATKARVAQEVGRLLARQRPGQGGGPFDGLTGRPAGLRHEGRGRYWTVVFWAAGHYSPNDHQGRKPGANAERGVSQWI